ncbi:MAG TPA: hypothetical protein VFS07_05520 [Gemmatimonadales bacterium]|nr:hypothetical protein [Gemmatimonadales bacterium]
MALDDLLASLAAAGAERAERALAEARTAIATARARQREAHQARLTVALELRAGALRAEHARALLEGRRAARRRVLEARAALLERVRGRAEELAAAADPGAAPAPEGRVRVDRSRRTAFRRAWPWLRIEVARQVEARR